MIDESTIKAFRAILRGQIFQREQCAFANREVGKPLCERACIEDVGAIFGDRAQCARQVFLFEQAADGRRALVGQERLAHAGVAHELLAIGGDVGREPG